MDPDRHSYVALLDILGFREMCRTSKASDLLIVLKRLAYKPVLPDVDLIQFSDSILLYTQGIEIPKFYHLVGEASALIGEAADRGIGLRGAITMGEFAHDADRRAFAGKALVQAHDLEQAQDWIGGIIDPALNAHQDIRLALQDLATDGFVFPYDAPMRDDTKGPVWCLGWPLNMDSKARTVRTWGSEAPSEGVRRKIANTNAFLSTWREAMQVRDARRDLPPRKFFPEHPSRPHAKR